MNIPEIPKLNELSHLIHTCFLSPSKVLKRIMKEGHNSFVVQLTISLNIWLLEDLLQFDSELVLWELSHWYSDGSDYIKAEDTVQSFFSTFFLDWLLIRPQLKLSFNHNYTFILNMTFLLRPSVLSRLTHSLTTLTIAPFSKFNCDSCSKHL